MTKGDKSYMRASLNYSSFSLCILYQSLFFKSFTFCHKIYYEEKAVCIFIALVLYLE